MTSSPELTFNDGNTIPQLGYGVWQVEDDVAEKVVRQAFEAGFRHIDTAKIYGNESGVGRAIASSGLSAEEIFITTKLWNADQGYESTLAAFEESMDRLGLETLDLYLIHWQQPKQDKFVDTWKALIELKKRGRVKSIGVSNFTKEGLQRIIDETGVVPAINQVELQRAQQDNAPVSADESGSGTRVSPVTLQLNMATYFQRGNGASVVPANQE